MGTQTILIVDDEPANLAIMDGILSHAVDRIDV
jgi:CheY-like chemotaxis protein